MFCDSRSAPLQDGSSLPVWFLLLLWPFSLLVVSAALLLYSVFLWPLEIAWFFGIKVLVTGKV